MAVRPEAREVRVGIDGAADVGVIVLAAVGKLPEHPPALSPIVRAPDRDLASGVIWLRPRYRRQRWRFTTPASR